MSYDFWVRETGRGVSVEWRIERFLSPAEDRDFFFLHSPSFSLSDAQWFLEALADGWTSSDSAGWIHLALRKRFTTSKTHSVGYTLGIRTTDGSVYESVDNEEEFEKLCVWEWHPLVRVSKLRQSKNVLSADGTLTVFATLRHAKPSIIDEGIPRALPLRATHTEEVSFEWEVEGFTSLPKEEGFSLKSPTFSLAGAEWCLRTHPNGVNSSFKEWVSLLLRRERSSSEEQTVAFTLGIRRRNGSPYRLVHAEKKFVTNNESGCWEIIKSSELLDSDNGLIQQGSVTFFCTLRANTTATLKERGTPTRHLERALLTGGGEHSQYNCATLHEDYRTFFLKESLGDVMIRVRDQKLPAHRAILAARSSVFSEMFEQDTEERRTGTVNVDDFDPEPFRAFLSFLYSGDVDSVTADNAIPLYEAADKYNLQDLRKECRKYLVDGLCLGSLCQVVQLAFVHSDRVLLETVTEFFGEHAKEIVVTHEWHAMMTRFPDLTDYLFIKMAANRL